MVKAVVGWIFPAAAVAITVGVMHILDARPSVRKGVTVGVTLAAVQAYLTTAALRWAWNRPYVLWVWGAGVLFRLVAFAVIAFAVYRFTQLNLVATMASMVVSMTVFLVVESATCLKG